MIMLYNTLDNIINKFNILLYVIQIFYYAINAIENIILIVKHYKKKQLNNLRI